MQKLRTVEMLRACAALLVVLYHATVVFDQRTGFKPFAGMFSAGFRGVDLFFVISGFIIAYVHGRDLGHPDRLAAYLYNRATRILPALWIVTLLAGMIYAVGFGGADRAVKLSGSSVLSGLLLLPQQQEPLLNVSWTLKYEAFFYLVFATGILNKRLGMLVFLSWQACVVAANLTTTADLHSMLSYYLYAPCIEFGIGAAIAWLLSTQRFDRALPRATTRWFALSVGFALFVVGMAIQTSFAWAGALCGLGAGLTLLMLCLLERGRQIAIPEFLVRLGGASYSVYLVHFSVITLSVVAVSRLHVPLSSALALLPTVISVLAGVVFDRVIDRPIQSGLRHRVPKRTRYAGAAE